MFVCLSIRLMVAYATVERLYGQTGNDKLGV